MVEAARVIPTSQAAGKQKGTGQAWWLVSSIQGPPVLLQVRPHSRGEKENR